MNIITLVEPEFEPVSVGDVYEHLRWDAEEDGSPPEPVYPLESTVSIYIKSAREFVEDATRRSLVPRTLMITSPGFRGLELRKPPFIALESVEYIREDGVTVPMATDDFYVTADYVPRLIAYQRANIFESNIACRDDAVRAVYRAGYMPPGSPPEMTPEAVRAAIPDSLRAALLIQVQLLADRFDTNEKTDLERTRDALLSSFKVWSF